MASIERTITVKIKQGLHARPAALLVQLIDQYKSQLMIAKDGHQVNARSIMNILMLGAESGCQLVVKADGVDADQLVNVVEEFLSRDE